MTNNIQSSNQTHRTDKTNRHNQPDRDVQVAQTQGDQLDRPDANRDPITGEPGAHPFGTGVGAAGVGSVTMVVGSAVAGPTGAIVGAVVGSVVGGLAGKSTAEKINPTLEDNHWRENYDSRPYAEAGTTYADYQLAYRTGYEGFDRYGHTGRDYSDIEVDLQRDYEAKENGVLSWGKAQPAVKDAFERAALSAMR
jgi:hypothetical protein